LLVFEDSDTSKSLGGNPPSTAFDATILFNASLASLYASPPWRKPARLERSLVLSFVELNFDSFL